MLGPGQLGQLGQRRVVLAQDMVRALQQPLAGLREHDAPRHAREERDADLLLQLLDLHAESGLRVVCAVRGRGERARIGDGDERFKLSDLH